MDKLPGSDLIEAPDFNGTEGKSGRAVWDARGECHWEWQTQPGVFSDEIDTQQLHLLESAQLELLERAVGGPDEPGVEYPRLRRAG